MLKYSNILKKILGRQTEKNPKKKSLNSNILSTYMSICHYILHQVAHIDCSAPSGKQHEPLTGVCVIYLLSGNVRGIWKTAEISTSRISLQWMHYSLVIPKSIFQFHNLQVVTQDDWRQCLVSHQQSWSQHGLSQYKDALLPAYD